MQKLGQSDPHCTYNNLFYQVCVNHDCTFNPFICQDICQCEIHHRQCEKINWKYIKDKLNYSSVKKNPKFQYFHKQYGITLSKYYKQVTKAYEDFIEWKNNFGFTEKESQFLKLIEDRRYNQITGSDIAIMMKQIRTPSKMIMKTQRQIQEKVLMVNTYAQSMLLQFSELYSKNKVIKVNTHKNNIENINQNKNITHNLVHRLLGLDEKGSKFLMMLNQNSIESKLQKLIEKVNSNEGTIMKAVDLKIEQLKQNIKDQKKQIIQCRNQIKREILQSTSQIKTVICQSRTETKTQRDDIKKEVTQFRQENKQLHSMIKNNVQILKQKIFIESKINNKKFKIISNIQQTLSIRNKQLLVFSPQTLKQSLKIQSSKSFMKIEQKFLSNLQNHIQKKLSINDLNKQSIIAQKQAELIKQEYDLMSKNFEMLKINAISFLFSKKIVKLDLLYRASQNNFQASKFHEKCDGKQHTITIIKTEFGNIIGGYTPLPWKSSGGNYQADNIMESFIFSLTNKHKLKMIQGKQTKAIQHNSGYGPIFGGGYDLIIFDKANQNNNSARPGNTYNYNNEYIYNTQQSYKKWSGQSSGYNYKIQEWQVYSIVFA